MIKKRKILLIRIFLLLFFLLLMLSGIGMILLQILYNKNSIYEDYELDSNKSSFKDDMVLNVLLVGLDELQDKFRGRSDSMMLVSLDARNKKIKVSSLMRDLWVSIPKYGEGKLNASYSYGGISLLSNVINSTFGIRIDRYIIVDFNEFENVIDQLGGIDLDLTKKEVDFINKYSKDKGLVGSGKMHLNGNQTLQFARDRDDPEADFKRTERQRQVISSIFEKIKLMLNDNRLFDVIFFIKSISKSVKTNFSVIELISLTKKSKKFINYPMVMYRVPENFECKMIKGQSALVSDLRVCKKQLIDFIYETGGVIAKNRT